ncbi:NPD-domain-containing protein [Jaminaea rosea]|uniref:NPD-domain-containing protein n=1 Tax=Jaminaea rosea TaxID=1569628 RepID=A0A316USI3_9BASI|nr:NPD-domain-containing protein [Jaminaea rosea]PWN27291.1 NPD-domain-containing protein [Jaminaea rosea]
MSAKRLLTPLTTQLLPQLRAPIVCGPMANASGGALTGAVCAGGGLGFIGAGYYTASQLKEELEHVYKALGGRPERGRARLEAGIGFLAWRLTAMNDNQPPPSLGSSDLDASSQALALIDEALRAKPRAVWMSFGEREELVGWCRVVREREAALNGGGKAKWGTELKLFVGVGTRDEARCAVEEAGADVVVVTGVEAGGHGLGASPPLASFLPLVRAQLPSWQTSNPAGSQPLLLAAGGLHSGQSLAACLAQGADGAVFGTRFLMTPEAAYTPEQKQILTDADESRTKRTMAFDEARGTMGWPKGVDGRGVVNETVHDYERGLGNPESRRERYGEAVKEKDTKRIVTWAGTGVGNVSKIMPAAEVVQEIEKEAIDAVERLGAMVGTKE